MKRIDPILLASLAASLPMPRSFKRSVGIYESPQPKPISLDEAIQQSSLCLTEHDKNCMAKAQAKRDRKKNKKTAQKEEK